ncbi:MAG: hypothetical protein SVM80_13100 [Halobacteriota archaeon]|nr:hypothetical protein [Halobacteriota archaeon]
MSDEKYLLYLDILGFKNLPKEIYEKYGVYEDTVREEFLTNALKDKIEALKEVAVQVSKGISEIEGSDNYVLIFDRKKTAIESVSELTRIEIPHKDYTFVPLEVALGVKEIDSSKKIEPKNRKEIVQFLCDDIINPYRKYYKENKDRDTIKETFLLFTSDFYHDLDQFDKNHCEEITSNEKTFFSADLDHFQNRGKIFKFLEKIGYLNHKFYGRIDEAYVPPTDYNDIVSTLKDKRIVFITGTQELGKTFTAVRLM